MERENKERGAGTDGGGGASSCRAAWQLRMEKEEEALVPRTTENSQGGDSLSQGDGKKLRQSFPPKSFLVIRDGQL